MENTTEETGLSVENKKEIQTGIKPILDERSALIQDYEDIIRMDQSKEASKKAKELRLKFRDNRTKGIMKWHKDNKEYFLRGGQFVDALKRKEVQFNENCESNLLEIEEFEIRKEEERILKLSEVRFNEASKFTNELDIVPNNLGAMSLEVWDNYLKGLEQTFNSREKEKEEQEKLRLETQSHNLRKNELVDSKVYHLFNKEGLDLPINYFGKMEYEKFNELHEKLKIELREEVERIRLLEIENNKKQEAIEKLENENNEVWKELESKDEKEIEPVAIIEEVEDVYLKSDTTSEQLFIDMTEEIISVIDRYKFVSLDYSRKTETIKGLIKSMV